MLLSRFSILLMPLTLMVGIMRILLGYAGLFVKRCIPLQINQQWWSSYLDVIDGWSVKGSRCSLEGLFTKNYTSGVLNANNLQFFSKIMMEYYNAHYGFEKVDQSGKPIVKS